jgi:hypothetical protein
MMQRKHGIMGVRFGTQLGLGASLARHQSPGTHGVQGNSHGGGSSSSVTEEASGGAYGTRRRWPVGDARSVATVDHCAKLLALRSAPNAIGKCSAGRPSCFSK